MGKRAGDFSLALPPRDRRIPAHRWWSEALRAAIVNGQLRPGARLPSTRDLAAQSGLSRGTIVTAFEQLASEGYVEGAIGSGTYVSAVLPDALLGVPPRRGARAVAPRPRVAHRVSDRAARMRLFPVFEQRASRAFRSNVPALDQFPMSVWAQLGARVMRRMSTHGLLSGDILGYRPLRAAIAESLARSRGVLCSADQVMIVAGMQEGLALVTQVMLDPGDRVGMEEPGYVGAIRVFESLGARILRVPVDEDGLALHRVNLRGARLLYVTPAHQYPLGVAMGLQRRLAVLEWARRNEAIVFEDDYDSEYRYSGHPLPSLHGLDGAGHVVFAGTFSKVLFPALRLGYLVLPPDVVDRFAAARSLSTRHLPLTEQLVLCAFITEGHFGRHVRRMRQLYAERLAVLTECARQQLTGLLELSPIEAGLQTVGWLARGISGDAVAERARARGVEVVSLRRFYSEPIVREGLQLGFAAVDDQEIRRGVAELVKILEPAARGGSARG